MVVGEGERGIGDARVLVLVLARDGGDEDVHYTTATTTNTT